MRLTILALTAALSGCGVLSQQQPAPDAPPSTPSTGDRSESGVRVIADPKPITPGINVKEDEPGLDLRQSVYYEFDRYEVKPEYRVLVERHAAWLRANPRARLMVVGNTDERGTSEYNLALGQRRAESVTKMLILMGAREEQIEAVSFGKEKPRASGHDEAAWAQNRRSDFSRP